MRLAQGSLAGGGANRIRHGQQAGPLRRRQAGAAGADPARRGRARGDGGHVLAGVRVGIEGHIGHRAARIAADAAALVAGQGGVGADATAGAAPGGFAAGAAAGVAQRGAAHGQHLGRDRRPGHGGAVVTGRGDVAHAGAREDAVVAGRPAAFVGAKAHRHDTGAHPVRQAHRARQAGDAGVRGLDEHQPCQRGGGMGPLHVQRDLGGPAAVVGRCGGAQRVAGAVGHHQLAAAAGGSRQRQRAAGGQRARAAGGQTELGVERGQLGDDIGVVPGVDDVDGLAGAQLGGLRGGQARGAGGQGRQAVGGADLGRGVGGDRGGGRQRLGLASAAGQRMGAAAVVQRGQGQSARGQAGQRLGLARGGAVIRLVQFHGRSMEAGQGFDIGGRVGRVELHVQRDGAGSAGALLQAGVGAARAAAAGGQGRAGQQAEGPGEMA
mmetsp:Transcript_54678/g.129197  ORF Transcript_54678/g.129197 Transcript_54678/m.129197 type:complete len:437 (+) Transcript_54678:928-2238(+)